MSKTDEFETFKHLCYHIGLALVTWQDVEEAHFKLFFKLIGAPNEEIASLAYHSIEAFDSRRVMVDRMVTLFCKHNPNSKLALTKWNSNTGGLNTDIKNASLNRNKLAHYGWENDVLSQKELPNGDVVIEFGPPKLQPSAYNLVSRMLGRTPERSEHNLDAENIREYVKTFRDLAERLDRFHRDLPVWPLEPSLVRTLGLPPKYLEEVRQFLTSRMPSDIPSSDPKSEE